MYSQRGSDGKRASFGQDIREMYSPNTVFHCFSPLKTYIRSLCCQQHAVRACISVTYCHEEVFLPSGPPLGVHDNRFLPLFNAQPFHAGHSGRAPGEWPTSDEGRAPGEGPALTAKVFPTGDSPGGNRGNSDWRLTRREQGRFGLANHAT